MAFEEIRCSYKKNMDYAKVLQKGRIQPWINSSAEIKKTNNNYNNQNRRIQMQQSIHKNSHSNNNITHIYRIANQNIPQSGACVTFEVDKSHRTKVLVRIAAISSGLVKLSTTNNNITKSIESPWRKTLLLGWMMLKWGWKEVGLMHMNPIANSERIKTKRC